MCKIVNGGDDCAWVLSFVALHHMCASWFSVDFCESSANSVAQINILSACEIWLHYAFLEKRIRYPNLRSTHYKAGLEAKGHCFTRHGAVIRWNHFCENVRDCTGLIFIGWSWLGEINWHKRWLLKNTYIWWFFTARICGWRGRA